MGPHFRRNVKVSSGFFLVRFIVSILVGLAYILVAAGIQYAVVGVLGESTFNYIVGGLLSLFLGAVICNLIGSLIFMFVRGWHVAALAYANKIVRSNAPAVTVGMKAFARNIVGFSAVYGVRTIAKGLLADFKDKLWDLLSDIPLAQNLQQVAENPIIEHLATDVLNYGFDATIFYLIKNPPEDISDVPSTVIEGLKRYLYCLPSIMLTSISSYILFRFIPKFVKWVLIVWVLFTQGVCAGILITVLMWPLFYILENTFFIPLTMIMFISCFSKQCSDEVDPDSPTVQMVNAVLEGAEIGTTADDLPDEEAVAEDDTSLPPTDTQVKKATKPKKEVQELQQEPLKQTRRSATDILNQVTQSVEVTQEHGGIPPRDEAGSLWDDMPLTDEGTAEDSNTFPTSSGDTSTEDSIGMLSRLSQLPLGGVLSQSMGGPGGPDISGSAPPPPSLFGDAGLPQETDEAPSGLGDLLRSLKNPNIGQALNGSDDDDEGLSIQEFLSGGDNF